MDKQLDAVSVYTQVKLEDAPRLLKIPTIRTSRCLDTSSTTQMATIVGKIEDPVVLLERNLYGHPLAGIAMGKTIRASSIRTWMGENSELQCVFVHRKQGSFLSENMDDIKMAGKNQNLAPNWKKLKKNVDIDEPTSFLDHVYLGCTQRECKPNEAIIEQYTKMFESRISAGVTE